MLTDNYNDSSKTKPKQLTTREDVCWGYAEDRDIFWILISSDFKGKVRSQSINENVYSPEPLPTPMEKL